jgi:hypothetical protein
VRNHLCKTVHQNVPGLVLFGTIGNGREGGHAGKEGRNPSVKIGFGGPKPLFLYKALGLLASS